MIEVTIQKRPIKKFTGSSVQMLNLVVWRFSSGTPAK